MNIVLNDVTVTFQGSKTPALFNVSVTFQQGESVGILGSSGAGKSTLIRSINKLVKPTSGSLLWDRIDVTTASDDALREVRTKTGMIFQQFNLVPRLSVMTNVLLGTIGSRPAWQSAIGFFSAEEKERATRTLDKVGLAEFAKQRVERLSGGQQQRVAIARMMMQQPRVILGDEPVSSLDPVISRNILEIIKTLHEENGLITIMNLHDVELAKNYANRIIGLRKGEIVFDGPPEKVTPEVQSMIYAIPYGEPAI